MTEDCKRIKNVWLCFGGGGWVSACIGMIHLMLVSLARTLAMEGSGKCCLVWWLPVLTARTGSIGGSECMTFRIMERPSAHTSGQSTTRCWTSTFLRVLARLRIISISVCVFLIRDLFLMMHVCAPRGPRLALIL